MKKVQSHGKSSIKWEKFIVMEKVIKTLSKVCSTYGKSYRNKWRDMASHKQLWSKNPVMFLSNTVFFVLLISSLTDELTLRQKMLFDGDYYDCMFNKVIKLNI